MMGKLIVIIAAFLILTQGAGAYLEDYTVIETFPDGQAKRGVIPDFFIYEDGRALIRDYSAFNADKPFSGIWAPISDGDTELYIEWNSYGQVLVINEEPSSILYNLYAVERMDRKPNDIVVYKENAEIVAYKDKIKNRFDISSKKTPNKYPPYKPAALNANEYMEKFGVDENYILNSLNYQIIYDNLYKLTPEYQAEENARLRLELEATKSRLNATEESVPKIQENVAHLNETVTQHSTWFNNIFNWIYENFGIDLR